MSIFLDEISVSLTVRRIVPNGADIFRLTRNDDVDGIKRLLSLGLASPNDSFVNGQSVIVVRSVSILINKIKTLNVFNCYVFETALYFIV